VPYRCFYSKNISNLFMAGRDISVDHGALGNRARHGTCGMEGEVVGKAASICVKENCDPRGVWQSHFDELRDLMNLPGKARRESATDAPNPAAPLPYDPPRRRQARPAKHASAPPASEPGIDPKTLPGIVIDDADAKLTGEWNAGTGVKRLHRQRLPLHQRLRR